MGNYCYAPSLGEQNNYVFGEILGISKDNIQKLKEEKVIY
jgi:crotonobetainyl-CoA:carnitine CoA-transferase CaiB-like acyl-CoA transferase